MKVWIDTRLFHIVSKSGIGKAMEHQQRAIENQESVQLVDGTKEDYDIVHFNTLFPSNVFGAIIAKMRGKRIVMHAHSTMEDFKNSFIGSNLLAPIFKRWLIFCYQLGDVVITPTEYSKALLESYPVKREIYVLSNGIDLSYFNSNNCGERKENKRKKIISVGHYIERKGLIDFVELAKQMPEYDFYWYGYTAEQLQTPSIKEALATECDNLFFPGFVDKQTLRDIYFQADLFLFMTFEETEGIVLLEVMAMKLPVILRDIPIYKKMFTDQVDVFKFSNLLECKLLIHSVLTQDVSTVINNAHQQAEKRNIEAVGQQLSAIYEHVLTKK